MLLYYITDRHQFAGSEQEKKEKLLARIALAASCGVDFIQLRERDLPARELETLASEAVTTIGEHVAGQPAGGTGKHAGKERGPTLLVNSRIDVAMGARAGGVHLRSTDIAASEARAVAAKVDSSAVDWPASFTISVACHSLAEVRFAESHGADLVLFAPIFEKALGSVMPHGVQGLRAVCRDRRAARPAVPVLALGGVTLKNARSCLRAGAAGVAGIRLFQEGDLAATVRKLRS